jgi:5-formyltetrahydrofolate cyclo-ligase
VNTQTKNSKIAMRSTLRRLRQEYVLQHADELEQECAKLARFAQQIDELLATSPHGEKQTTSAAKAVIASFKPHSSEINPGYLEEALKKLGHEIVWPRVEGKDLRFFSDDQVPAFVRSSFGLLEPGPNSTEKVPSLFLMPLLAFDAQGQRLGQGGGFYDRTLERLSTKVVAIGIAWDCQEVANVPVEPHDMPLTGVITPSAFHRF